MTTTHSITEVDNYQVFTIVTGDKWKENSYLLRHKLSENCVLLDPGDNSSDIIGIIQGSGGVLRKILLTHAHFDHVGAVATICKEFNLPCEIHRDDVRLLRQAPIYALRFASKKIETPQPVQILPENGTMTIGEENLEINILHTPGHTPGSVCYVFGKIIFTGDTLLNKRIGRTDMPGGDAALLKESVNRLMQMVPDNALLFPGHGSSWTMGEAKEWWVNLKGAPSEHNAFEP